MFELNFWSLFGSEIEVEGGGAGGGGGVHDPLAPRPP